MSTTRISQLTSATVLNSNTSNVVVVALDTQSGITQKVSGTILANGLYANNALNVGNSAITLPNTVAQFALSGDAYIQTNLVNKNNGGSADYVASANTGNDTTYFVDVGYANKDFVPGLEYNSLGNSLYALDGYVYTQGDQGQLGGNLVIGTTTTGTNVRLIVGGGTKQSVVLDSSASTIHLNRQIQFGDGTTQNTSFAGASTAANTPSHVANSAAVYANGAFSEANAAFTTANNTVGVDATQNTNIQLAWNKANSALQNTSGTFDGNLSVTGNLNLLNGSLSSAGNLTVNGTLVLANTNFGPTESAITIKASANVQTPSNDGYMLHISGKQNVASRIVFDSYSSNGAAYGLIAGRTSRGTVDAPAAVQAGDVLMRISGNGWGSTGFTPLGVSRIDIVATETHTDAHRGSQIKFYNTPNGSNTLQNIATLNGDSAQFTGVVNPQKGLLLTPNVVSGNITTLSIDVANNSLYKISANDNVTISLNNFQAGKLVEVWITNSAAQNKTITHGCFANNSTSKSTSFTITASSCAYLKYFSIDGDQANTFVSITA